MAEIKEKKDKKTHISKDTVFFILNLVLAVVTMALCATLTSSTMAEPVDYKQLSIILAITIFSQVLFEVLLFFAKDLKRDKIRAIIVGIMYIIAIVMALIANEKDYAFYFFTAFFVVLAMAINQFLSIHRKETKKGKVTNILLGIMLTLLAGATVIDICPEDAPIMPLVIVLLFLFISFKKILFPSLKIEKVKLLINILVKTHTIDVIICLISFMIAFSFILPRFEENITNFWDGMWYCFAVITTIGFGDFYATSLIGRTLTVILGIYGIIVVAIITSVIVNFYNEVSSKEKARDFIE